MCVCLNACSHEYLTPVLTIYGCSLPNLPADSLLIDSTTSSLAANYDLVLVLSQLSALNVMVTSEERVLLCWKKTVQASHVSQFTPPFHITHSPQASLLCSSPDTPPPPPSWDWTMNNGYVAHILEHREGAPTLPLSAASIFSLINGCLKTLPILREAHLMFWSCIHCVRFKSG